MPRRILYALDTRVMHRIVAVLVLASAGAFVWLAARQQDQVQCSARYNARSAAAQQARAEAADRDRRALTALLRSLVDDTPGDARAEIERYLDTIEETDRERQANPVPPPPADLCT
jgi:hypothetical protein